MTTGILYPRPDHADLHALAAWPSDDIVKKKKKAQVAVVRFFDPVVDCSNISIIQIRICVGLREQCSGLLV